MSVRRAPMSLISNLSFRVLRQANLARLPQFRNAKGDIVHPDDHSNDWLPVQWLQAVLGELGEFANLRKKIERGDFPTETKNQEMADELADIVAYLDLLAHSLDIDLGDAVVSKFNSVSHRVGSPTRITSDGRRVLRSALGNSDCRVEASRLRAKVVAK